MKPITQKQRLTIISGILGFVLFLVVMQLWLLSATMNAYLANDQSIVWPGFFASLALLLLNIGLLRYMYKLESISDDWRGETRNTGLDITRNTGSEAQTNGRHSMQKKF